VHYYPQASGVDSPASDPATQQLRIRSTRSLDDPNYTDESWIGVPVNLIPRLKAWIADNYPGTKLAITEYRWGGEKDASGAVALANEDSSHTATLNLNLGLSSAHSLDRFNVTAGSSQIVQYSAISSGAAITLRPYSLTLLRLKAA